MWDGVRAREVLTEGYFGVNEAILFYGLIFQPDSPLFSVHESCSDISEDNLHKGYFICLFVF